MATIAVKECITAESNNKLCAGTAGSLLIFLYLAAGSAGCVNREQARVSSITRLQWPVCTGRGPIHLMEEARGTKLLWGCADIYDAMMESLKAKNIL